MRLLFRFTLYYLAHSGMRFYVNHNKLHIRVRYPYYKRFSNTLITGLKSITLEISYQLIKQIKTMFGNAYQNFSVCFASFDQLSRNVCYKQQKQAIKEVLQKDCRNLEQNSTLPNNTMYSSYQLISFSTHYNIDFMYKKSAFRAACPLTGNEVFPHCTNSSSSLTIFTYATVLSRTKVDVVIANCI